MDMSEQEPWPFDQPPQTAVFTTRDVAGGQGDIVAVHHDADDDGWQFLGAGGGSMEEACLVSLKEIVDLDASVLAVADLPPGSHATRAGRDHEWKRHPVKRPLPDDPWGLDYGVTPKGIPGAAFQALGRLVRALKRKWSS